MNDPLVSIVTPSYNQGRYIEECILSVINQDYPAIEFIIMDGGSTDGAVEVIQKYSSKISYWISEKDRGQSDAINKGWKMAKGELFFYLNSDDKLENNSVVSTIVELFKKNPKAAAFYGDCIIIDANSKQTAYDKSLPTNTNLLLKERVFSKILHQTCCFFNAKYVQDVGYLKEELHYCMDYDLIVSLSLKGQMVQISKPIACFREHYESKTHTKMEEMLYEQMMIKWKFSKIYFAFYFISYCKFKLFKKMPLWLQMKVNPALCVRINS